MSEFLFSNDSPLRVRRVRGYRVPRYPSHTDPDPTLNPEPVPYPWKSSVAAALLALGETGCGKKEVKVAEAPAVEEVAAQAPISPLPAERAPTLDDAKVVDEVVAESMRETTKGDQNPFAQELGFSGLPYVTSPYGTGAPTYLDAALAQKLITQLFAAEGLKPQPATFTEEDFTASAQVYDPEERIGIIFGDGWNLAEDVVIDWQMKRLDEIASGKMKLAPHEEKQWSQSVVQKAANLVWRAGSSEERIKDLGAMRKLDSAQAKAQAYLDLIAKLDEPKLSMEEIKRADMMAEERQRYLAIITVLDSRFQFYVGGIPEFRARFENIADEAGKRKFASSKEKVEWIMEQEAPIYDEAKREQLVKLAQSVREYIAWARRNGLQ